MGIDGLNPNKPEIKIQSKDLLDSASKPGDSLNAAALLHNGDSAARSYGKGTKLGELPSCDELLAQINKDEKQGKTGFDRMPFAKEREVAHNLTAGELKSIGTLVDCIKNGKLIPTGNNKEESAADVIKSFKNDPGRLAALKDMVQVELERQDLDKKHQVDVMEYREKNGDQAAVVVIANSKDHSSIGIKTDGKRASKELLNFLYN